MVGDEHADEQLDPHLRPREWCVGFGSEGIGAASGERMTRLQRKRKRQAAEILRDMRVPEPERVPAEQRSVVAEELCDLVAYEQRIVGAVRDLRHSLLSRPRHLTRVPQWMENDVREMLDALERYERQENRIRSSYVRADLEAKDVL